MSAPYRLYGAELSPYSVKVRSYLRYKGLEHEWLPRSLARQPEFSRYAKLPLIPVLVSADEQVLQDSTPMMEALETRHPEPAIQPEERALQFLSLLIEDYADEWLNKAMFHYRWSREDDQASASERIVTMMLDGQDEKSEDERAAMRAAVKERMTGRLHFVGSNASTGPVIEAAYRRLLGLLETHFAQRPYLFGGRPALGDFGLAGQLQQLLSDPTPGALMRTEAPGVVAYCTRMDNPGAMGGFESLTSLAPSLSALLRDEIAGLYLPWMDANAAASRAGDGQPFTIALMGQDFTQTPQRYAAKAFMELKRRRASFSDDPALAEILGATGCDAYLAPTGQAQPEADEEGDDEGGED
jgi:glutathione S-transferase